MLFKQILSILIIVLVLAGMITIIAELIRHAQQKRKLAKPEIRWKVFLLIIGLVILIDKVQYLSGL